MPEISIIVPVYRAEKWLDRCIKSILNQTFTDFELILVNDGSPDYCPQMCDDWQKKDSRIKVIHKENGGASSARNVGLKAATGVCIGFVDSDDWIEPNMYELLYNDMQQNNAQMAICRQFQTKNNSNDLVVFTQSQALEFFFRMNGEENNHTVCMRLMKKELFNGWEFIEGKMNEDVHACYCLTINAQKVTYRKQGLYHYFFNNSGVTNSKFNLKKLDLIYMWDEVYKLTQVHTPQYIYACDLNKKRAYFTLLSKMLIDGYDRHDLQLKNIKKELKKEVRASFWELMKWKMPISRKLLLVFICT